MNICVFGAASPKVDAQYLQAAEELGEALAKRGHSMVFGGGANGLMGAAARGMKKGGGKITGVIPQFFLDEGVETVFEPCDELIIVEDMAERKDRMEELSDAFVIAPGGIGTFEELFQMLVLKQLGRHKKPIAIYNVKGYYYGLETLMQTGAEGSFLRENTMSLYRSFKTEELGEMLEYIETEDPEEIAQVRDLEYM